MLLIPFAFHGEDIEKLSLLNNYMYKSTPIRQVSHTAVVLSESFITIKKNYLCPRECRNKL